MATLPRYQNLGIQYADLPKISTAAQQAQVQGFEVLSRSLDRMTSYFQSQAETEAKKQAKKYAVENPLTTSQLEAALKDPSTLKIEGAGSIFQETYQAYAAGQLSTDLQLQAGTELKSIELDFEAGNIDAPSAAQKMRDLLDGQSSVMNIVSPEASIQHRSAVATLAKTSYNKVLDLQQKADFAIEGAKLELGLQNLPSQIEDVIKYNAGSTDPETGKPVDLQKLMAIQLQPYAESIRKLGGDKSYFEKALKIVDEAKVGAVTGLMQDRNFAPNPIDAFKRMQKGDYGNLTPVYNSLDQANKDKVRSNVLKGFSEEQTLFDMNEKRVKAENKEKANTLNIELLRPNTSARRQREIVYTLVGMDEMTLEQADKHLNGEEGKGDVSLFLQLNDQISRGAINSLGGLTKFKDRLSSTEYKTLGTSLTSTQGNKALKMINLEAGIRENAFSITEDQKSKQKRLLEFYEEELTKKTKNENGVEVYAAPTDAATAAIKRYADAKIDEKREKVKTKAATQIENAFNTKSMKNRGITLPNLPIDEIDFGSIKGLTSDEVDLYRGMRDKALKGK
jgi:hypothetical protein